MLKIALLLSLAPLASAMYIVGEKSRSLMPSNAMDRVNRFDDLLMREYRKNGVNGIAVYFSDAFTYRNFAGQVLFKQEFLDRLRLRHLDSIFPPGDYSKTAYFRAGKYSPRDLLVVTFYKDQVNYVLTLKEDNALRAGYRFLSIRPASE